MDTKRLFDVSLSSIGIIATAPLFGLVGLIIKLDSAGPILFRQERVGRGYRHFQILKFRTMVADAAQRGPAVTTGGDNRVTRVGRVLRATKLDELPQLLNVLAGDMSIVGPRPEVPKYVEAFRTDYDEILQVRPGITDLASIEFRREEEILARYPDPTRAYVEHVLPTKIRLARDYVARQSFWLDVSIVARTVTRVVFS